jgi:hypothetical protein
VWKGEIYINVKRDKSYINVLKGEIYIDVKKVVN